MQPSMPNTAASTNIKRSCPPEKVGTCRLGSSALKGGMVLRPASWNKVIDRTVPKTSARSCGGQKRLTLRWGEPEDRDGDQGQSQLHRLHMPAIKPGQIGQGSHHPARCGLTEEGRQLENHQGWLRSPT